MSDINSGLPTRTQLPGQVNYDDMIVKVGDATNPSTQQLAVNANGSVNVEQTTHDSLNANTTIQVGDVDVSNANPVPVSDAGGSLTVDANNLDIRDLVFATDKVDVSGSVVALDAGTLAALESITVQNPAGASAVNIQDGGNSITVDGTVSASNFPATVDTNYGTVGASTLRSASQLGNDTGAVDYNAGATSAQTLRTSANITHNGTELSYNVGAADANTIRTASLIHDGTDTLAINSDGSINVVPQEDPGTETINYNTASAVASGANSTHDLLFATAGKLFQVLGSASGKMKMQVQVETGSATDVFNTVSVRFNSTANPNCDMNLQKFQLVSAGARVRVIRTNLDALSQDLYSTIVAIIN